MVYDRFSDPKHIKWAKKIKERDSYCCQICGKQGGKLHAHHMNSFDIHVEERFDIDNGITLCSYHHELFHLIFGKGCNTKSQFKQYYEMMRIIIKKAKSDIDR